MVKAPQMFSGINTSLMYAYEYILNALTGSLFNIFKMKSRLKTQQQGNNISVVFPTSPHKFPSMDSYLPLYLPRGFLLPPLPCLFQSLCLECPLPGMPSSPSLITNCDSCVRSLKNKNKYHSLHFALGIIIYHRWMFLTLSYLSVACMTTESVSYTTTDIDTLWWR